MFIRVFFTLFIVYMECFLPRIRGMERILNITKSFPFAVTGTVLFFTLVFRTQSLTKPGAHQLGKISSTLS